MENQGVERETLIAATIGDNRAARENILTESMGSQSFRVQKFLAPRVERRSAQYRALSAQERPDDAVGKHPSETGLPAAAWASLLPGAVKKNTSAPTAAAPAVA